MPDYKWKSYSVSYKYVSKGKGLSSINELLSWSVIQSGYVHES